MILIKDNLTIKLKNDIDSNVRIKKICNFLLLKNIFDNNQLTCTVDINNFLKYMSAYNLEEYNIVDSNELYDILELYFSEINNDNLNRNQKITKILIMSNFIFNNKCIITNNLELKDKIKKIIINSFLSSKEDPNSMRLIYSYIALFHIKTMEKSFSWGKIKDPYSLDQYDYEDNKNDFFLDNY